MDIYSLILGTWNEKVCVSFLGHLLDVCIFCCLRGVKLIKLYHITSSDITATTVKPIPSQVAFAIANRPRTRCWFCGIIPGVNGCGASSNWQPIWNAMAMRGIRTKAWSRLLHEDGHGEEDLQLLKWSEVWWYFQYFGGATCSAFFWDVASSWWVQSSSPTISRFGGCWFMQLSCWSSWCSRTGELLATFESLTSLCLKKDIGTNISGTPQSRNTLRCMGCWMKLEMFMTKLFLYQDVIIPFQERLGIVIALSMVVDREKGGMERHNDL